MTWAFGLALGLIVIAILTRLIFVERKHASASEALKALWREKEMADKYRESIEREVKHAEELLESRLIELKTLKPNDSRWNDLTFGEKTIAEHPIKK